MRMRQRRRGGKGKAERKGMMREEREREDILVNFWCGRNSKVS